MIRAPARLPLAHLWIGTGRDARQLMFRYSGSHQAWQMYRREGGRWKIPEELIARVDELIAQGAFRNRSAAVREGLQSMLTLRERRRVDDAFREALARRPEADEEMRDAYRLAAEAIHDEPWEKWW